ncbi:MAG: FKBP-type peptidyl-prolyl cis-trans isomerase [Verrucomicrobia bacterium]|nr:FKBP-type peptidyl-prolyl cis-trans isomerase [Verrucomicrobiota bacterium]
MQQVLGGGRPNWDELINPQTDDARARRKLLVEKYKMDPRFAKEVDAIYGPLEWRLPESHALYWAVLGLRKSDIKTASGAKIDDPIVLRRVIYQSLSLAATRGRLIFNPADRFIEFGPNLALIPKANAAYEEMIDLDQKFRDNIVQAHRNFIKQAVNDYYIHGREQDAVKLYTYARKKYPDYQDFKPADTQAYVMARTYELIDSAAGRDKIEGLIEGFMRFSYYYEALGESELAFGYQRRAQQCWMRHQVKVQNSETNRVQLSPITFYAGNTLARVLNEPPPNGFSDGLKAMLRTARGLPQPTNAPTLLASRTNNSAESPLKLDTETPEEKDRRTGLAFLAKNKMEGSVRTTPSGLQYQVLVEGKRNGRTPKSSDTVRVHYTGWMINGTKFDSSRDRGEPFVCRPDGEIIKGWKEALLMMKEGAKWKLFIPWQLAYGESGKGGDIRPFSVLIFEIELLDVKPN